MRKGIKKPIKPIKMFFIRALIMMILMIIILLGIDFQIRPIIETMASYQAKVFSIKTINNAISEELIAEEIKYGNIVKVAKNNDGVVSSVETNMVALNEFKSAVTNRIASDLKNMENSKIHIPMGSLLNNQFLSGRGPDIVFQIIPSGFVDTEIENQFKMAGINQTLHRIMLEVRVEVSAIIPGYRVKTVIDTNFCIAETVIVGTVPEAFTNVDDGESSLQGKIFDYGAELEAE